MFIKFSATTKTNKTIIKIYFSTFTSIFLTYVTVNDSVQGSQSQNAHATEWTITLKVQEFGVQSGYPKKL